MRSNPEHALQTKLNEWVRECVAARHKFLAFDRSQAMGRFTHAREKARGIKAGTPDTVLMVLGLPDIWVELKALGKKPEPGGTQEQMGADIIAVGRAWHWCDTVAGYRHILLSHGVPLAPFAELRAMQMDAVLERPAAEKRLAKRASKGRAARPDPARVRKVNALRQRVMF